MNFFSLEYRLICIYYYNYDYVHDSLGCWPILPVITCSHMTGIGGNKTFSLVFNRKSLANNCVNSIGT